MASFSELPSELVEHIASYLGQAALYATSQLTRSLYTIIVPFLYRHVDLLIPLGNRLPRIDKFCFNILNDAKLAEYVRSLRVGLSSSERVWGGQQFLPNDNEIQHGYVCAKAQSELEDEALVSEGEDLRTALGAREYGAYAALIFMKLPSLHRLDLADCGYESLRPLHRILHGIVRNNNWQDRSPRLAGRITSIKEVSYNFDWETGMRQENRTSNTKVWQVLPFSGLRKVEFPNTDKNLASLFEPPGRSMRGVPPTIRTWRTTSITTMTIRHSSEICDNLNGILQGTPHLQSLTCELWHDSSVCLPSVNVPWVWISLERWSESLKSVRTTLKTLVLSVEFFNGKELYFRQPDIRTHVTGHLDLRNFTVLQDLEVPVPFVTGDPVFWFAITFEPCLPPNLRHLTLRPDMSRAQFPYAFDSSILSETQSFQDSQRESNYLAGARMDMTCVFQTSLYLVDKLNSLNSITVWQPPDPTLAWFEGQMDDFVTSCRNKSVSGRIIYPQILRRKAATEWDLVQEVTLFDPSSPQSEPFERLFRGERNGIPLGLATQYHLGEFRKRHVRRHR
ncbi:hypothetical protein K458DRAFT_293035 [Lentithecium fluviatile CBS 122367]|uniref:F-box domain-containing protein n=1 Tax=Lentithecium fluviatile CBS 122367 TaxID=1168545 RepID=A0A6G1JEQ3_9PLEO|nr:hypothetical protein K458DRAFT_293035 [Lentithecium fluviatile CBS 122367]